MEVGGEPECRVVVTAWEHLWQRRSAELETRSRAWKSTRGAIETAVLLLFISSQRNSAQRSGRSGGCARFSCTAEASAAPACCREQRNADMQVATTAPCSDGGSARAAARLLALYWQAPLSHVQATQQSKASAKQGCSDRHNTLRRARATPQCRSFSLPATHAQAASSGHFMHAAASGRQLASRTC